MTNYEVRLGVIKSEDVAAITSELLNNKYPNVNFEASESGYGGYVMYAWSKYDRPIHPKTQKEFSNTMHNFSDIVSKSMRIMKKYNMLI